MADRAGESQPLLLNTSTQAWINRIDYKVWKAFIRIIKNNFGMASLIFRSWFELLGFGAGHTWFIRLKDDTLVKHTIKHKYESDSNRQAAEQFWRVFCGNSNITTMANLNLLPKDKGTDKQTEKYTWNDTPTIDLIRLGAWRW